MAYRKFAADGLFTGTEMLGKDVVLITDKNGNIIDLVDERDNGEGIERFNGILCPGFVNCHCHLELSHMLGKIPPKIGMVKFLLTVMNERLITEQEIEEAADLAAASMYENGIVAVGDICNTSHSLKTKTSSSIYFQNFIEATGFVESSAELRMRQAREVFDRFKHDWPSSSIVPHAPYSVSDKLLRMIDQFDPSSILSIHNQESEAETEFFAYATGGFLELYKSLKINIGERPQSDHSSLVHVLKQVSSSHSMLLVHNVHTGEDDFNWINCNEHPSLYWCLCPNANMYISEILPNVMMLKENNCRIVVGTDSLASNTQLNILEELKTMQMNFPELETSELLRWATRNGAEALRIEKRYGSFEVGKRPGVVNIDGTSDNSLNGSVARRIL